jgi:signal transduction histidine kinase
LDLMVWSLAVLLLVVLALLAVLLRRDATVRAKLEQEKRRTEALYAFGQRLAAMSDVEPLAQVILAGVTELTGYHAGAVYVVGESGRSMRRTASFGVDERALPERLRLGDPREVLQVGVPELVVELTHGDSVLGFLTLAHAPDDPGEHAEFTEVGRLAEQSAVALAHALALRRTRRLLDLNRAVLNSTQEGITMVDLSGRLVFANRMMEEFYASFGVPAQGTVWERLVATVAKTTTPDSYIADFTRVIEDPELVYENEFTMADSGRSFHGVTAPVHDSTGRLIGRIFSLREVSAEREADRVKDEFVATVSHELRTPLTSMFGFTEVLLGGDAGELTVDQRRYLEIVQRSTERLMRLVGDLLFIGQIDSGQLALEPAAADLAAVAGEVVETARPTARMKGIELVLRTEPVPEIVADRSRLAQLTDNLLSNALKFTPEGGRVEVTVHQNGDCCVLEVSDSGFGVDESDRDRLFERFFRSAEATEQAIQGTGLGLAISKAIVEAHGGTIEHVDRPGPGATFRVELPLGRESASPSP